MVKVKFEAIKKKTASFWVSVALCGFLAACYFAATVFALFAKDASLLQNTGAIGVACVVMAFALKSQFDARRHSWHFVASAIAISDLMVSVRKTTPLLPNEVTSEQAGKTVQQSLDMLDGFHQKSELWLFIEVVLLVLFTLQWGFGHYLFNLLICGYITC